jgi:hypothetical protein
MPLKPGMTREEVFHDLRHGPHHKDRTRKQEIAIAMRYKPGKKKKRKGRGRK